MKKILGSILMLLLVGCSNGLSKNIDLVCEGKYNDNSIQIPFTLHIKDNNLVEIFYGSETKLSCESSESTITCNGNGEKINLDRYSLAYSYLDTNLGFSAHGKCKISDKQI